MCCGSWWRIRMRNHCWIFIRGYTQYLEWLDSCPWIMSVSSRSRVRSRMWSTLNSMRWLTWFIMIPCRRIVIDRNMNSIGTSWGQLVYRKWVLVLRCSKSSSRYWTHWVGSSRLRCSRGSRCWTNLVSWMPVWFRNRSWGCSRMIRISWRLTYSELRRQSTSWLKMFEHLTIARLRRRWSMIRWTLRSTRRTSSSSWSGLLMCTSPVAYTSPSRSPTWSWTTTCRSTTWSYHCPIYLRYRCLRCPLRSDCRSMLLCGCTT